jgi:hypothetical protein
VGPPVGTQGNGSAGRTIVGAEPSQGSVALTVLLEVERLSLENWELSV